MKAISRFSRTSWALTSICVDGAPKTPTDPLIPDVQTYGARVKLHSSFADEVSDVSAASSASAGADPTAIASDTTTTTDK